MSSMKIEDISRSNNFIEFQTKVSSLVKIKTTFLIPFSENLFIVWMFKKF